MRARVFSLILVAGISAATAGAAPPPGRNGLITFVREQGDNIAIPSLYTISARGSPRKPVTTERAWGPPSWAPNGRAIVFPTIDDVVIARADGRSYRKLKAPRSFGTAAEVAWSPAGRRIAIANEASPLYVKTLRGGVRRFTRGEAAAPVWSPNGRKLAYVLLREYEPNVLIVARSDGKDRRLMARSYGGWRPSWSADGKKLVVAEVGITVINVATGRRRQLTRRATDADPVWSPDGSRIAFRRQRSRTDTEIFTVRPDGSGLRRLTHNRGNESSLTWSPDGRSLAFVGKNSDVFVVGRTGGRPRRLSRERCGAGASSLTWSPRGDKLAYEAMPYGSDAEIFTAGPDGRGLKEVTHTCTAREHNPAWSPNGDRIAFDRPVSSGSPHVYVMNADGSETRRVTSGRTPQTDPSWSPDGTSLVYSRDGELVVIGADGSGERQITDTPGANDEADWSPRNNRIVFASTRDRGPPQVYVMNADGSGATRLTDVRTYRGASQPAWSPDGARIAFVRDYNIWTMNADGTDAAPLTRRDGYSAALHPAWSPDGTLIVFSADNDLGRGSEYALAFADAATGTERYGVFEYQDNLEPDWQVRR